MKKQCMILVFAALMLATSRANSQVGEIEDIRWELGPNLPELRKGGCATVLSGKLISVFGMRFPWGEMATTYIYDPRANHWSRGPDAPIGQCYVHGTECGGSFYAIGGRGALEQGKVHPACFRLDETPGGGYSWTRIADLNEPRGWAPSVTVSSKMFVFGGSKGGHGPCLSSVEMLDSSKPDAQWEKVSEIPGESRGWCGAAAANGKVYLLGGGHFFDPKPESGSDRKILKDTLEFHPATKKWTAKSPLPYRTAGMDCCVYKDRYVIVVGGAAVVEDYDDELLELYKQEGTRTKRYACYYCPFVQVYDTHTDTWRRMPSMLPFATNDIRVVLDGETLYAIGGENIDPPTSNTTAWLRIGTIVTR